MLSDNDRKWLEQKQLCEENAVTCYTYRNCSDCFAKETCYLWPNDYKDVAEFEAGVAAKILDVTIGDLPCAEGPDCQAPHFYKYNTKEKAVGCNMCTLCVARLAVEAELEAKR